MQNRHTPFDTSNLSSYLLLLYMKLESHLSRVCLSAFWCRRANLAASASISTGHVQKESCIFWNMQDYVSYFTGMLFPLFFNTKLLKLVL